MKISTSLAAAGAILTLSAGAVLAAESCECCKSMAADASMSCCDEMQNGQAPVPAPSPDSAPAGPSADAPDQHRSPA